MLRLFSRMERARNWVIILFALVIGLSMVLFTLNRYANPNAAAATNSEVLASVNGDDITVGDLNRVKEDLQQRFGGQINLAQLGGDRRFLDSLIRERVIAQEAVRLGLGASDAEVAAEIRKQFIDASGKFVGLDSYKERVAAQYGSVAAFEETLRNQIAADKLRAFVTASVTVSEKEVEDDYKRKNTMFDLTVVNVSADKLAAKVQPTDDELQKFYDEHKTEFRYFDPQKKIRYLFISQSKVGEKLNIPDADLKAAYDQLKPENKLAGVRAQQIILKVARPDLDTEVMTKATKLLADMGGGGGKTVTAEKFAEVARGNSEDPATARNGGWLPQPVKKNPNAATAKDPAQHVFDLTKEGEAGEPVKYGDSYYIFRRGDEVTKTFEQAKPELLASQRNTRAYKAAADIAARAAARLKETKDFQKVAQELAPEANMTPAEMIKETPFVKPGDDVPDIGSSPQFEDAIKPLENAGDIGDRVPIKNGFAIPSLIEKREPRIPDLSEVKDKIAVRVKQEKARGELEATARDVANNANAVADLKAAAEKHGLEATPLPSFHVGTPLGDAGASAAADEAINNLKEGEITKTPVKVGESWVVVGVTKRKDADLAEFAKQRDSLVQSALTARRGDVFEDYVGALKSRLERDGKIKIYDDVLARIGDSETLDLPPAPAPVPRGSR